MPGTITQRFPTPAPVTRAFLTTAYTDIGLAGPVQHNQRSGRPEPSPWWTKSD
jgi:hypothetical protein